MGMKVVIGDIHKLPGLVICLSCDVCLLMCPAIVSIRHPALAEFCGVLVQYPDTEGTVHDFRALANTVHDAGALVVAASDLLACTTLTPPG